MGYIEKIKINYVESYLAHFWVFVLKKWLSTHLPLTPN